MATPCQEGEWLLQLRHVPRYRVLLDIANSNHKMRTIHRVTGKTRLKQMTAPSFAKIDRTRASPMRLSRHRPQAVCALWNQHKVDVIVHQTPRKATRLRYLHIVREQSEIFPAIVIGKEDRHAPVAALGHVVSNMRNHNSCQACQGRICAVKSDRSQLCILSPEFTVVTRHI